MSEYDKCIEMLCITGKMPVGLYDSVCAEAHKQIYRADKINKETQADRDRLIFGERKSAKDDYYSAWLDLEEEEYANFECE